MKKMLLYTTVLVATLNLGCENKLFRYTVSVDQSGQFVVDDPDGVYITSTFISRTSVAKSFNLPDGARVKELKIESLSLSVVVASTNAATAVTVNGYVGRVATTNNRLFNQATIPLVGADLPIFGLNALIEENIGKLQTELENFVKQRGTASLVEIAISGVSVPPSRRISFTIQMHIKATVQYERCEEIIKGMSEGPGCAEGETAH